MEESKKLLDEIMTIKKREGWSYDRLALEIGIHPQTLYAWLRKEDPASPSNLSRKILKQFIFSRL